MTGQDIILNDGCMPTFKEITDYIGGKTALLWIELNTHIQGKYKISPKYAYSSCSGKPGWNLKYHKSGKALCTLYPEKDRFIILIVVTLAMLDDLNEKKIIDPYRFHYVSA